MKRIDPIMRRACILIIQTGFSFFLIAQAPRDEWMRPEWIAPEQVKEHRIRRLTVVEKEVHIEMGRDADLVSVIDFDAQGHLLRERNYEIYWGDTLVSDLRLWFWSEAGTPDSAVFTEALGWEEPESVNYTFHHDVQGRLLSRQHRKTRGETLVHADSLAFLYDLSGHLLRKETWWLDTERPRCIETVKYLYDSGGRLACHTDSHFYRGADTTFFQWGPENQLREEWQSQRLDPEEYLDHLTDPTAADSAWILATQVAGLQKVYTYTRDKITTISRTTGLPPTDLRYDFYLDETWLNSQGLPERKSSKFKERGRNWIYFYYEYY